MHGKYQRLIQHAERERIPSRRQRSADVWEPYTPPPYVGDSYTVTIPLTVTIQTTSSVWTTSTSSSSSVATSSSTPAPVRYSSSQYSSSQYVSSQYTSSQYTPSQTESLSQTSSSSSILLSSVIPLSSTPSALPQGNNTVPQGSVKLSAPPLSSGGIAGVVLACLILLFIGLFFGLRRRFQRNRLRLRGLWTRSKNIGDPYLIPANSYEPKSHSSLTFRRSESGSFDPRFTETLTGDIFVRMPPPPTAYNNNHDEGRTSPYGGVPTSSISNLSLDGVVGGGGDNMTASNVPMYYSPGSANRSPLADATVVFTFITTLPDELSIRVGETIRVLEEYDDGWALCMNMNGQQGMVPLECLNRRRSAAPSTMSDENLSASRLPDARGVRRASSLDPGPALKAYRS